MSSSFTRAGCAWAIAAAAAISPACAFGQIPGGAATLGHPHRVPQVIPDSGTAVETLLSAARKASEAWADRGTAISAGYRRVGMDFPSMGEHWVNPRLLFEGKFDVTHPAILTYSIVRGRPQLLGVVYAIPLGPGEEPPADFGAGATWHEHNGSLEQESLLPEHHSTPASGGGTRLAVLHAWVRAANPDGVFAAENWALPFIRLGLDVPVGFPKGAARAISLLSGGERYFSELDGGSASGALSASLPRCAMLARRVVSRAQARGQVMGAADLEELDEAWTAVVLDVGKSAGPDAAKRINGGSLPGEMR